MLLPVITACDPSDSVDWLYTKACLINGGLLLALDIAFLGLLPSLSVAIVLSLFFVFRGNFLLSLESRLADRLGALSIVATTQVPIWAPTGESQAILIPLSEGLSRFRIG